MTDDEKAVRQLIETWMHATRSGDLATVLSLMSDDVIFMVPGKEPFGKNEFAAASQELKDVRIDGVSDVKEVKIIGSWAYVRTHLTVSMTPLSSGNMVRRSGYTLSILNKTPTGAWVLVRDANLLTAEH
jgi:uncharacterized protein (TIGR02246 family)